MDIVKNMQAEFKKLFGDQKTKTFFSPGRVNLIGEHTDYNGGNVFPCAISLGTYAIVAKRTDKKMRLYSMNIPEKGIIEFEIATLSYDKKYDWANYPMGVIQILQNHGFELTNGFDILFYGTLPNGAGLSSSASLEVLTGVIFNEFLNLQIDRVDLVKMSQEAENKFVGVNCGIMDQFAVGMGKKNHAILLDCNTLAYRYSKIELNGYSIVIANTNKTHSLGDSKYNERRGECEAALAQLKTVKSIKALGELTDAEFDELSESISSPIQRKRAHHAVYENQRTLEAVAALENKDLIKFGQLMNASHVSLRDDYEVTGIELDTLAELAWEQEGVLGSRMTGAGFGGCTVSIVKDECIAAFEKNIAAAYTAKIGYAPDFYVANISDGAGLIK